MSYPESLPYLGQNWKKLLKDNNNMIYATEDGKKVGVKKVSIKRASSTGTAAITGVTLDNGKKLKKKDIGSSLSIKIEPYEVTAQNAAKAITGTGTVNKKGQVKGLKCTFSNEAGVSGVKEKKIPPKNTKYDKSTGTVTFNGNFDGVVSGNLIGVNG